MAAWQQRVLSQVAMERSTMGGLYNMDAKLTRQLLTKQPAEHQGLLRCALNGTQYTQDALYYAGKVDSLVCKFCGQPDSLEHRYAACTVIWDGKRFCSLSCGGVQGLRQTSLRAEICAAISALKYLALRSKPGRLWIDNKQVYDMLDSWNRGGSSDYAHKRDSDLWHLLFVQFQHSSDQVRGVLKVQAHLKALEQAYEVDIWAVQGNTAADACASAARLSLPNALMRAEAALLHEMTALTTFGKALH
eukprot:s588_g1.t1